MSSTTTIVTPIQSGSWDPVGGVWSTSAPYLVDQVVEGWSVFNVQTIASSLVYSATFRFGSTTVGDYTLDIITYKLPRISDFTSASPPTTTDIQLSAATVTVAGPNGFGVANLPLRTSIGQAYSTLARLKANGPTDSLGQQRFAFGVRLSSDSPTTSSPNSFVSTLSLTVDPQFTGLSGPVEARGRADECPKCGGKSTRDTWTRDGYTKMMVCPECYDEEDRVGQHYQGLGSERPGQGEG